MKRERKRKTERKRPWFVCIPGSLRKQSVISEPQMM